MKTKGQFIDCILTRDKPIISGRTENGLYIYADQTEVEKGFKMFRNYLLDIFDDGEEVPYHGFCHRSKIIRIPFFDFNQIPEWMRISRIKSMLDNNKDLEEVLANLECFVPDRLRSYNSFFQNNMHL